LKTLRSAVRFAKSAIKKNPLPLLKVLFFGMLFIAVSLLIDLISVPVHLALVDLPPFDLLFQLFQFILAVARQLILYVLITLSLGMLIGLILYFMMTIVLRCIQLLWDRRNPSEQ
jgi:hypothetical protein